MKVAIIGTRGVGKSTLFRVLTGTTQMHQKGLFSAVGVSEIEDPRLEALAKHTKAEKTTPIHVEVYDFDGFGKMWKEDEAGRVIQSLLGFDALIQVLADFSPHNPQDTFDEINLRLLLSDLDFVTHQLERLKKEKAAHKVSPKLVDLFEKIMDPLSREIPLKSVALNEDEKKELSGFGLLTLMPRILVVNRNEKTLGMELMKSLSKKIEESGFPKVEVSLPLEEELLSLGKEEEESFRKELGVPPFKENLWKEIYKAMDLVVFYTIVHGEVRAWTVKRGATAIMAAGKIHTDMEKGFIRAEVITVEKILEVSSFKEAQKMGLTRIEGRNYQVEDGDILHIRFSPH